MVQIFAGLALAHKAQALMGARCVPCLVAVHAYAACIAAVLLS